MSSKILVIDDEDIFREDLAELLRQEGYQCETASNGEEGLGVLDRFRPEVILCDIVLPGTDGIEILDKIMQISPESFVIMITAYGSLKTAVDAFRKGAADYITKPPLLEDILQKIRRLIEHKRLSQEVKFLRREVSHIAMDLPLVGQSEPMKEVLELIKKVGATRSTVLLRGKSGTGKEVVARAIHAMSDCPESPFVPIHCAGIPEHLLESELFGHIHGAFTGTVADKEGFFELSADGTLFLDEIAEMPPSLQSKLLRVLEEREFYRVGETTPIPLKSRVIVSTNRSLRDLVAAGKFREDLYFRIAVFEIVIPALRERRSDIPLLVHHFVKRFNQEMKRRCFGADNEVIHRLMAYSWPGNVRELRNVIEHAMILNHGDHITLEDLPPEIRSSSELSGYSDNLRQAVHAYEAEHIRRMLSTCGGNREQTARRLGINPSTLYRKMGELGLGRDGPKRDASD